MKTLKTLLFCLTLIFTITVSSLAFSPSSVHAASNTYTVKKGTYTTVAVPAYKGKHVVISCTNGPLDVKMTNRWGTVIWSENSAVSGSTIYATNLSRDFWCGTDVYYVKVKVSSRCPYNTSLNVKVRIY